MVPVVLVHQRYISCGGLCSHTIHHNHVRYFGKGRQTVSFEYQPVELLEVVLPPAKLAGSNKGSAMQFWRGELQRVLEYVLGAAGASWLLA